MGHVAEGVRPDVLEVHEEEVDGQHELAADPALEQLQFPVQHLEPHGTHLPRVDHHPDVVVGVPRLGEAAHGSDGEEALDLVFPRQVVVDVPDLHPGGEERTDLLEGLGGPVHELDAARAVVATDMSRQGGVVDVEEQREELEHDPGAHRIAFVHEILLGAVVERECPESARNGGVLVAHQRVYRINPGATLAATR